jgi:hypothetical protein
VSFGQCAPILLFLAQIIFDGTFFFVLPLSGTPVIRKSPRQFVEVPERLGRQC